MSVFASALLRATDRVYTGFGEAATHTDRNGAHTPCTVLVETDLTRYGETAQVNIKTAVLSVRLTHLAAAPRAGEVFTITASGKAYRVDSLQSTDALEHKVFVA